MFNSERIISLLNNELMFRYIERFRHGSPRSRAEREEAAQTGAEKDFWWLTSDTSKMSDEPTDTSTPISQQRTLRRRPDDDDDARKSTGALLNVIIVQNTIAFNNKPDIFVCL